MYTINDLPKYSKWPARLLGLSPYNQRVKSKSEIYRIYEVETYGACLEKIRNEGLKNTITTRVLDTWQCKFDAPTLYTIGDSFFQGSLEEAHLKRIDIIRKYVNRFFTSEPIVELGCGYGSVILTLAGLPEFKHTKFLAAEYTPSGRELTKLCAKNQGIDLDVGWCDFADAKITDLNIPKGALIITCSAVSYIPILPNSFTTSIKALKPKMVIHFEPIYEHYYRDTLLDMMRRRYTEIQDYNRNLLTLLKNDSDIRILLEEHTVMGINPLYSQSVVAWRGL